jgi:hypothetical protein
MSLKVTDIEYVREVLSGEVTLKELASDTSRRKVVTAVAILYASDSAAAELAARRTAFCELLYELTIRPGLEEADKPRRHEAISTWDIQDKLVPLSRRNGLHSSCEQGDSGVYLPQQPLLEALFREDERFRVTARDLFAAAMATINDRREYAAGVAARTKKVRAALAGTYVNTSLGYYSQTESWSKINAEHVKEAYEVLGEILRLNFPELLEKD